MDHHHYLTAIEREVSNIPTDSPLRAHFDAALRTARLLQPSSQPQTLLEATLRSLTKATSLPRPLPSTLHSASAALSLVLHTAVLRHHSSFICTGAHDTPPGASFATPHRPVDPSTFLPPGWDADNSDSFHFRYQRHGVGRLGSQTLYLHCARSPGGSLTVHASVDRCHHGGGRAEAILEVPLTQFPQAATPTPHTTLTSLVGALVPSHVEAWGRLQRDVDGVLLGPLLGEREEEGGGGMGDTGSGGMGGGGSGRAPSASTHASSSQQPFLPPPADHHHHHHPTTTTSGIMGIPVPLTGTMPGDFDGDLYPNPRFMAPGGLLIGGGRGGSLVGPGHPLFGGGGEGGEGGMGGLPPGVPPGARFDPIGPFGVGGRGGIGRGGVGRGGRGLLGGPDNDVLRPPPWNDGSPF